MPSAEWRVVPSHAAAWPAGGRRVCHVLFSAVARQAYRAYRTGDRASPSPPQHGRHGRHGQLAGVAHGPPKRGQPLGLSVAHETGTRDRAADGRARAAGPASRRGRGHTRVLVMQVLVGWRGNVHQARGRCRPAGPTPYPTLTPGPARHHWHQPVSRLWQADRRARGGEGARQGPKWAASRGSEGERERATLARPRHRDSRATAARRQAQDDCGSRWMHRRHGARGR